MKTLINLSALLMLSFVACKKDPVVTPVNFAGITRQTIVDNTAKINQDFIFYNAPTGDNFKAGSIIFFKTSAGNFGKMEVVSVSANLSELVINVVVYDALNAKIAEKSNFKMLVDKGFDFDDPLIPEGISQDTDFAWYSASGSFGIGSYSPAALYLFKI